MLHSIRSIPRRAARHTAVACEGFAGAFQRERLRHAVRLQRLRACLEECAPSFSVLAGNRLFRACAIAAVIGCVLLGGTLLSAKPAYRLAMNWRAERLAAGAERLLAAQDIEAATLKAQSAYLLRSNNPRALRVLALISTERHDPRAAQLWQQVLDSGTATEDDRRAYVQVAIEAGALEPAGGQLQWLLVHEPHNPLNLWLAARYFGMRRDLDQSARFASQALALDPSNRRYQLFLANLRYDHGQLEQQAQARNLLWRLAHDGDETGLEALVFLSSKGGLAPEDRQRVIELLLAHPLGGVGQEILALEQRLILEPHRRAEIIREAAANYPTFERAVQFAAFLNKAGEPALVVEMLAPDQVLDQRLATLIYLDSLAALNRWDDVSALMESDDVPLEETLLEIFRARCSLHLGQPARAALHWERAHRSARRRPEELWFLARYADQNGFPEQAHRAYRALIPLLRNPSMAYMGLKDVLQRQGRTAELCELITEMSRRWPNEAALQNDYAYLNLLLGRDVEQAAAIARTLVRESPASLPHRATLALAYYRLDEPVAALRVLESVPYDWNLALPGNRAVYAAVLAANGRLNEATAVSASLPAQSLQPEERILLQSLSARNG